MNIPNYDSRKIKNNNFKSRFPYMPQDTFRMLICGNTGCGKMNLLYHMLMSPLLYYDQIHLYAKNLEQDKYQKIIQELKPISKQVGYNVILCSNDEIIPVDNLKESESQKIIIFDDFICQKNRKPLVNYFIQGRHKNCSVIYLSQSFYKTPKDIRLNCSHYCIYDFPSNNEKTLFQENWRLARNNFLKLQKKPYPFYTLRNQEKT